MAAQRASTSTTQVTANEKEPEYDWYDAQGDAAMPGPLPQKPQVHDIPQQGLEISGHRPRQGIGQQITRLRGANYHYIGEGQRMHVTIFRHIVGQQVETTDVTRNVLYNEAAGIHSFARKSGN